MKIAIVVGTRPEIIKMSPVIKECENRGQEFVLIHTNQHYSPELDDIFFQELELTPPAYHLNIGKQGSHANQTGNILIEIEPILEAERPELLLVQGDTNTVLASALAASKLGIKLGHVEAGLRSYDKTMPEETNRVVTDHISDYLFAVTDIQRQILVKEGVAPEKIFVVGNTITDALLSNRARAAELSAVFKKLELKEKEFILFTAHRASNVDSETSFKEVIEILNEINTEFEIPVVWPMHPRAKKKLMEYGLTLPQNVLELGPLGYFDFLDLLNRAKVAVTDSGGVQEEACILGVPCLTIRENTERPETIEVGANTLVGRDKNKIISFLRELNPAKKWNSPFGNGTTAKQILEIVAGKEVSTKKQKTISVIGLGYMGLPLACLFSKAGHSVQGVDIDDSKVKKINQGIAPFREHGLDDLLNIAHKNNFRASTQLESSDIYVIAVPTPAKDDKCNLDFVMSAAEEIANVASNGQLVILESTVKPNTCKNHLNPFFENKNLKLQIAFAPERAFPGNTIYELIHNDRIVGGLETSATDAAAEVYSSFVRGEIIKTTATCAESVKLFENTFRDVNIALANEFDEIATELGINVWEVIALANKHPRVNIHLPGPGVGGHCIAIDPQFLVEETESGDLIRKARKINESRPQLIAKRSLQKLQGRTKVGILGAAFKKNVDDCRESPALTLFNKLTENKCEVKFHDPLVNTFGNYPFENDVKTLDEWADLIIVATDHDLFKNTEFKTEVLDTRNLFKNP